MSRIVLKSKLFDIDIEADSLGELLDMMEDTDFPIDKSWMAKIELRQYPEAKPETVYTLKFSPKKEELVLKEKLRGAEYDHPMELDSGLCNCWELGMIPSGYVIEFLQGLPSAMEYIA